MKIKEGFILRQICGEYVVVGEGLTQVNFNKLLSLNESAAWLWEQVQGKEFTAEDLATLMTDRYDVTWELAMECAQSLMDKFKKEGVAE